MLSEKICIILCHCLYPSGTLLSSGIKEVLLLSHREGFAMV